MALFRATDLGFKNQKTFFAADLTDEQFGRWSQEHDSNWSIIKGLLKHKDCPAWLALKIAQSPEWWKRLVAFCARPYRRTMFSLAIKDPKSTVRAAAYKGALKVGPEDDWGGWLSPEEVRALVSKDERVHGYFQHGVWAKFAKKVPQTYEEWETLSENGAALTMEMLEEGVQNLADKGSRLTDLPPWGFKG